MPPVEGHVYRAELSLSELQERTRALFDQNAFAVVRRPDRIALLCFDSTLPETWPEGQAFSADGELRWRREGEYCAVLLLTEEEKALPGFAELPASPFQTTTPAAEGRHGLRLWGTHKQGGSWMEARIPRRLDYPLPSSGKEPPRLVYRLYRDRHSRAVQWVRLVTLEEKR